MTQAWTTKGAKGFRAFREASRVSRSKRHVPKSLDSPKALYCTVGGDCSHRNRLTVTTPTTASCPFLRRLPGRYLSVSLPYRGSATLLRG